MANRTEIVLVIAALLVMIERMIVIHELLHLLLLVTGAAMYLYFDCKAENEDTEDDLEDFSDPREMDID